MAGAAHPWAKPSLWRGRPALVVLGLGGWAGYWILGRGKRGSGSGGVNGQAEAQHRDAEDAGTRSSPLLEQKERPRCSCS